MTLPTSRVTDKGQIAIPIEMRRELGISKRDTVVFVLRDGAIEVRRAPNIEDYFGSITPLGRPEDFDALEEAYEQGVADDEMGVLRHIGVDCA